MMTTAPDPRRNRLLASLPRAELDALVPQLELVEPALKQVLIEPGAMIRFVYFPLSGVLSVVQVMAEEQTVEVATVGKEGMAGVAVFLGADTFGARVLCQIPGQSLQVPADALRAAAGTSTRFREVLGRYTNLLLFQIARGSACNRAHTLDQRAARWILTTRDHVGADEFPLTHEFLAQMLGVRRAGVSEAAARLRHAGLIAYNSGRLRITDHTGLEAASCECYRLIALEFERMLT